MTVRRIRRLPFCAALCVLGASALADAPANLFANGDFAKADADGVPTGWANNTRGHGYVKTHAEAAPPYVEIGIASGPEDSFIQQIIRIPDGAVRLRLSVTYRHDGIVPGEKGFQMGRVQGRFTKGGKDFGTWIDMASLKGSLAEWTTVTREVTVDKESDGLMLRLGFYGCKAGKLEVSAAVAAPVTTADIAADRAKFRPAEPYGEPVSEARYGRIMRGININGWFCQPWNQTVGGKKGGFNAEFLQSYITTNDLAMIKAMGYDHIRLPVDPTFLCDKTDGALLPALLPELDRAIALVRTQGLALIVDVHPKSPDFKGLADKPDLREAFVVWWGNFAAHLAKTTDPEWVFLELMNEPGGQKYWANQTWSDYQDRLITRVRASAPAHTLIANGGAFMLVEELGKVKPHPDRNLIWAVHYYEPSQFTHQGAVWMKDWYQPLNKIPWPCGEPELEQAVLDLKPHAARAQAEKALRGMVKDDIATPTRMAEQVAAIAAWGQANGVRIHVGEYGVLDGAPRESRVRYLAALNAAFEKHGLARAMWNYSGSNFSSVLGKDDPGQRQPDWELARAMGLPVVGP